MTKKPVYILSKTSNSLRSMLMILACALLLCACSTHKRTSYERLFPHADLICNTPQLYANKVVGDGHCVSLIKKCALAPMTKEWRAGQFVLNYTDQLPLGAIIATFENGRYSNRTGHHAAIYISHDQSGIWVWDQWRGKAVHRRHISARNDGATASNSAQAYRVVKLAN